MIDIAAATAGLATAAFVIAVCVLFAAGEWLLKKLHKLYRKSRDSE